MSDTKDESASIPCEGGFGYRAAEPTPKAEAVNDQAKSDEAAKEQNDGQ